MSAQSNFLQGEDLAERRILVFERRFGEAALNLACHAAFTLTLTTDLLYCLRESFKDLREDCPWYTAADILLSGLCNPIGYDLYQMEERTRLRLLHRLVEHYHESRLLRLEAFMCAYINHRLQVEQDDRPRILGDRPHWTALACLRPTEAVESIKRELQRLVAEGNAKERLRLAAMVESYADLLDDPLSQFNFRPLLLDWAECAAQGQEIKDVDVVNKSAIATQLEISLKPLEFEFVTLSFDDDTSADELQPFNFEVVTVNAQAKVISTQQQQAYFFTESLGKGVPPLEMVAIVSGKFMMGSPPSEMGRYEDEDPQHKVTLRPFFMGKYPVTQAQWRAVAALAQVNQELKIAPSRFKGDNLPVEQVSWDEAVEFCSRLAEYTGRPYRLPSEAQWEYACRAGTTTPFHFGETITGKLANYNARETFADEPKGEYRQQTTPVGQFPPNAFGLYDMHGNVWEWCEDDWHDNYEDAPIDGSAWRSDDKNTTKLIRGGSWCSRPTYCRCASRNDFNPGVDKFNKVGLRVVCVVPRTM
ncbi:MAG: formylglycine-generating enzyme family protein [Symploca sp. SIO2B6]|nr:formylglycine-generating enzyme family protein [Symploca sp. SIO2B6]